MVWFYVFSYVYFSIFLDLGRPMSIVQVLMIYMVDNSHLHAMFHNYVFRNYM